MEETVVLVRMFPEGLEGGVEERKRDEDAMVMECGSGEDISSRLSGHGSIFNQASFSCYYYSSLM